MTNREAIASLKTLCNTCTMFPKCVNNKPECFQAIEMAISALEKQEQDRWIPVTERLPEEDCSCRVTEGDFKSVFDCYWSNHKKQFEFWSYYNDCYMPITNVTAWKPIEEPYTEDEA